MIASARSRRHVGADGSSRAAVWWRRCQSSRCSATASATLASTRARVRSHQVSIGSYFAAGAAGPRRLGGTQHLGEAAPHPCEETRAPAPPVSAAASSSSDGSQYNSWRSAPSGTRNTSMMGSTTANTRWCDGLSFGRRFTRPRRASLLSLALLVAVALASAQAPPAALARRHSRRAARTSGCSCGSSTASTDVTRETRVRLFPAGRRGTPIKLTLGADRAYEADVPVGLYDVQAIRDDGGADSIAGVRWVERMLVQKYPDEYGRHLQVVNLKRRVRCAADPPRQRHRHAAGWSAVATPPGVPGHRSRQGARARSRSPAGRAGRHLRRQGDAARAHSRRGSPPSTFPTRGPG